MIQKVAVLMNEQLQAYARLESAAAELCAALTGGNAGSIESLTRAGESELLRMRARLLEITSALTKFAELRTSEIERTPLRTDVREQFEAAAKKLLEAARSFQKVAVRASSLAIGGSSFATACIQMCGIPPTTYQAPVLRQAEGGAAR